VFIHPAWSTIFKRAAPLAKVLDVRTDVTDLTVYTFTAVNIGDLGGQNNAINSTYGTNPHLRSSSAKSIFVIVHAADAATTFGVTSVTIGGIAGLEIVDRGGATNAINTGIYVFPSNTLNLQAITDTDVVVTMTEAVTGCAIGVVSVENVGVFHYPSSATSTSTGALTPANNTVLTNTDMFSFILLGSTCAGPTETISVFNAVTSNCVHPTLLYESNNGEFAYAAAWAYSPTWNGGNTTVIRLEASWSGGAAGDAAAIIMV